MKSTRALSGAFLARSIQCFSFVSPRLGLDRAPPKSPSAFMIQTETMKLVANFFGSKPSCVEIECLQIVFNLFFYLGVAGVPDGGTATAPDPPTASVGVSGVV